MRRVLLLLQASLLSASCSQRPSVVVTLPNMPQQAGSFSVLVSRDAWTPQGGAQAASEQPTFDVSGFSRTGEFSYRFGLHPPTGTSSRLSIGIGVFDRSGCLLTTGVGDVAVSEMEVDQDVRVNLDAPPAEYMARCRKTTPTLRSAVQSADSAYTLEVSGWGFHPRAQLLLDDQPLSPTKWTWSSLTAPLPELKSPTGIRRATVTVKNPDGTSDSLAIVLNTLTFASVASNTYAIESGRDAKSLAIADARAN
ncbi:MAG: hypothetical protein U1A78_19725 [Polyangia bacterium]